jgi:hypothetical protein
MENFIWKLLPKKPDQPTDVVFRIYNGRTESMSVEAEEYKQWLEEGNTPLPAEENI